MSDDRIKRARRGPLDGNGDGDGDGDGDGENDRDRPDGRDRRGAGRAGGEDEFEESKTEMVDLDELAVGSSDDEGRAQPPEGLPDRTSQSRGDTDADTGDMHREGRLGDGPTEPEEDRRRDALKVGEGEGEDRKTAMVDPDEMHREGELPDPEGEPAAGGADTDGGRGDKMRIPGGSEQARSDEKTAFVDLDQFADEEPDPEPADSESTTFAPDEGEAGHEGSTQFVDVDALKASQGSPPSGGPSAPEPVDEFLGDHALTEAYHFDPQSIDRGDITVIAAQNTRGEPVLLRRIWEGSRAAMPADLRNRLVQLDELDIDGLMEMNGMLVTQTGCWVELERPDGQRLSRLLRAQGPQPTDRVRTWSRQIADVLDEIHDAELIYGNLTPDAVWVGEDETVSLESFDLVRLEDRGGLGPYGPPELKTHPENRQLSPASDVYSLGAVTLAGLTGLPLDPDAIGAVEDDQLRETLRETLRQDPDRRAGSAEDVGRRLGRGELGFDLGGFLADLDIKVAAPIAFAVAGLGAAYYVVQQRQSRRAATPPSRASAQHGETDQEGRGGDEGQTAGPEAGTDGAKTTGEVAPPGPVESDPRVNVQTSYRTHPPEEERSGTPAVSDDDRDETLAELRERAEQALSDARERSDSEATSAYKRALASATRAVALKGGDAEGDVADLREEILSEQTAGDYYSDVVEELHGHLKTGSIGAAQISYQSYAKFNPHARSAEFFDRADEPAIVEHEIPPNDREASDE